MLNLKYDQRKALHQTSGGEESEEELSRVNDRRRSLNLVNWRRGMEEV